MSCKFSKRFCKRSLREAKVPVLTEAELADRIKPGDVVERGEFNRAWPCPHDCGFYAQLWHDIHEICRACGKEHPTKINYADLGAYTAYEDARNNFTSVQEVEVGRPTRILFGLLPGPLLWETYVVLRD